MNSAGWLNPQSKQQRDSFSESSIFRSRTARCLGTDFDGWRSSVCVVANVFCFPGMFVSDFAVEEEGAKVVLDVFH